MPNKDKNIPKRRFKAFENADAWELRRIFEIADRFDNLRIPIASSLRVPGRTPYYGANGIQDYVEGYTHDGEFVLVAEDGANDLKNYPVNLVNGKIWVNNHAHVLQGKENIANNNFLSYSINRANIEVLLVGGGRAKLNSDVLMDIELEIPSLPEQETIGTFFSTLDRHITLHQRKLDKLKSVKQAYLSEMFPAEGERVPKRRFPGFTDDWELRKLGEVADIIGGGTPSTSNSEFWDGDIDWYTPAEIGEQIYVDGSERKITQLGLDKSSATLLPANKTILFTSRAGIGKTAILRSDATTNQGFQSIVVDNNTEPYFIFSMTDKIKNKAISVASGSTFAEISSRALGQLEFMFPSINEQEAIGSFFSTLDQHITLHQRKLEKLKNLKKALLNELFV
ncbi:TPA: restriction endonuclease subunit S [Streptococcus suis]